MPTHCHAYSSSGTYHVSVIIADDDGDTTTKTFDVVVSVPPVLATVPDQTATRNVEKSIDFSFTGLALKSYNYSINWGDPSGTGNVQTGSATTDDNGDGTGDGTFTGKHIYKHKGTYTVFVTVTDPVSGDNDTIAFIVTVS